MPSFRCAAPARRLPAAAACALAAHALLYRSLQPSDGAHGYFSWYEPAVAAASFAALAGVLGFVLAVAVRRHGGRTPIGPPAPLGDTARALGASTLAVLLAQESLERSLVAGKPAFAAFSPFQWLVLLLGVAIVSLVVALALNAGLAVVRRALAAPPRTARARRPEAPWSVVTGSWRRPRPLAERFGLRAPPPLLG
jgi:hypothetical protein